MTDWFKKLNIKVEEIMNYFEKEFGFVTWHEEDGGKITIGLLQVKTESKKSELVYYSVTPFYIKKMFTKNPTSAIDNYMQNADWTTRSRVSLKDFSSTPQSYYDIFLSKCNKEERAQFLKELKDACTQCIKEEIAMLNEEYQTIKTAFDKEIVARKNLLKYAVEVSDNAENKPETTTENNNDDAENE